MRLNRNLFISLILLEQNLRKKVKKFFAHNILRSGKLYHNISWKKIVELKKCMHALFLRASASKIRYDKVTNTRNIKILSTHFF